MATDTISYFKFTKVDEESGFSIAIFPSKTPVFPDLPGLNVFFGEGDWFYGTADSSAKENRVNNIIKLTEEQIFEDFSGRLPMMKQMALVRLSDEYQQILTKIKNSYDEEDSPIGLTRYQDAKAYVDDGTISSALQVEVDSSGMDIDSLTSSIISGYEEYIGKINALTALKTKISHRINSFSLSEESFIDDFTKWHNKTENLGEITTNVSGDMDLNLNEDGTYELKYYSANLTARWEAL